jgi:hypothetical protein
MKIYPSLIFVKTIQIDKENTMIPHWNLHKKEIPQSKPHPTIFKTFISRSGGIREIASRIKIPDQLSELNLTLI